MTDQNEVNLGGKLGPRTAKLLSDAIVYTRQKLGPHQANLAQLVLADFTNHVSDEVRSVMSPVWQRFVDDPKTPENLRPLFHALATGRGQAWAWIAGSATGAATGGSLTSLFSNLLAPVVQQITQEFPNALLSPESIAAGMARGVAKDVHAVNPVSEAAKGGLDSDRLMYLVELARNYPTLNQLQDMWNRKLISLEQLNEALTRHGIPEGWRKHVRELAAAELSLSDLSAMWNRSVITESEAVHLGARVGYDERQVKQALEIGGEPLPPEALGEAFRRGMIDSARYQRGIVQGPIRNEWFDVLERLQFSRMSTVDAADAVNQGHLSPDEGKRVAHENGLLDKDFEVLIETAGTPPGIEFATEALNRGFIDEAQFRAMFLESRIKNRYANLLLQMRTRLIPQETARLAYRQGVYSREAALRTLLSHGFTPDDAATLLAIEDSRQDETTRELTRAQVVQMYEEQVLDVDTSRGLLQGMGYSESNVDLMIALSDVRRTQKFINAAITRVRSAYLTGKLDENEVVIQLDALGIPPAQREELLVVWSIDRSTVSKTLTPSQIRQAFGKNLISEEDALGRLLAQGYDEIDAALFLQLTA